MGGMKDRMIQREGDLAAATAYLVSKKKLSECEGHGTVYGGGYELDKEFYPIAMADRKRGDNGPIPWAANMPAREFTDILKSAYDDHPADSCYSCDKNAAD